MRTARHCLRIRSRISPCSEEVPPRQRQPLRLGCDCEGAGPGSLAFFVNEQEFGPVEVTKVVEPGTFTNEQEFGPIGLQIDYAVDEFDNVNEFGPVEISVEVPLTPFDNAPGFGGVTTAIEIAVDAAPFDNVNEFGGVGVFVGVDAAPFDNVNEFGGIDISIDVGVDAAPFDNTPDHRFGATEYCFSAYPDTSTESWTDEFVTTASGSESYAGVFGSTPSSGDLLILLVHSQEDTFLPTITGFTRVTNESGGGGLGTNLLFVRLADGTEPTNIVYSGWTAPGGQADYMRGLIIPAGEHFGTADSDTVQSTDQEYDATTVTPDPISTGWGAGTLMTVFCSIVAAGSGTLVVPSGYTVRVDDDKFALGDTFRSTGVAELQVDGDSETPGAWGGDTGGQTITFAVRGPEGPCVYGGLDPELAPFDNVNEFGPVNVGSEILVSLGIFPNTNLFGPVDVDVEQPITVTAAPFDNSNLFGGVEVEVYPIISDSTSRSYVDNGLASGNYAVTLPDSDAGDLLLAIIAHNGSTPTLSSFTLVTSTAPSGGVPGLAIFKRTATGGEGATVTGNVSAFATALTQVFTIIGSNNDLDVAVTSATSNPPVVTYSIADEYNIALASCAVGVSAVLSGPSGYLLRRGTSEGTTPMQMRTASKEVGALSEDPPSFGSTVSSNNHIVCTIVVHGA